MANKFLDETHIFRLHAPLTIHHSRAACPDAMDMESGAGTRAALLPDTKLSENISEQIFGGNRPGDLAEVVQCLADVHR